MEEKEKWTPSARWFNDSREIVLCENGSERISSRVNGGISVTTYGRQGERDKNLAAHDRELVARDWADGCATDCEYIRRYGMTREQHEKSLAEKEDR